MDTVTSSAGSAASAARDELLRQAIARARRSEFYGTRLAGCDLQARADLERLPLTFKDHLRDASPFGMLTVPAARAWHYHETSGTKGEPISTWCGLSELRRMAEVVCRMVPELSAETILLNRFPLFAPVSFVFEEALRQADACHIAAGNMTWDVPFSRVLDLIRRLRVTALSSLPLEPILLRELALMQGADLRRDLGSLRVIFCGGAVLPAAMRRVIEKDWDARVVEIYGSNETMLLGVGCTEGRLHLCAELLEFEVLDPQTHQPVPPGERGLLTVTSLVHEVMPLVRYVTGDLVQIDPVPCACGAPTPTARVLGRAADVIAIGGGRITPYALLDACYEFIEAIGARVFFVVVLRRGLELLVEAPVPATRAAAERRLAVALGVPVAVQYLEEGEVLDRSALFRSPKIYKPGQVSDWRGGGRKTVTIMEALLEWPRFDLRTIGHILRRQVRSARRRKRLVASDR